MASFGEQFKTNGVRRAEEKGVVGSIEADVFLRKQMFNKFFEPGNSKNNSLILPNFRI